MTDSIASPLVIEPGEAKIGGSVILEASPSGVAVVLINRAHRKNAFDAETIAELTEAFEALHGADHIRVVFLRGAGGTFSAGADLEWMASAVDWSEDDNRADAMGLARMLKALHDVPALTVALVEGSAFGGGAGLVAACDTAVATQEARFSFSEVKLGLTPATISPYVVAAIGPRASVRLFATGRVFGADEAKSLGLVEAVVADTAGLAEAQEAFANEMMATAPGAVADAKRLVWDVAGKTIDHALMDETARRIARRRVSPEGQEGVRAFLGRRKPSWAAD
jgi:methylglutaconyl-CoA hydratase